MALSPIPLVRRPSFSFQGEDGAAVGRHWFGGSALRTHLANGLNFVFPEGERFFIRSVRYYADQLDPELKLRVAAFAGQEAQHQRAHLASFAALEAQGYEIDSWLRWYHHVGYDRIEPRCPPILRLATTAALEHFTATFGELALRTDMLDTAHPTMRALLRWHAAEEIEHRDVAFDVLLAVDPRWIVRVAGFVVAGGVLAFFWSSGVRHLRRQDPPRGPAERASGAQVRSYWRREGPGFAKAVLGYLRPGFHPRDAGGDALAEAFFAESAAGEAAPAGAS